MRYIATCSTDSDPLNRLEAKVDETKGFVTDKKIRDAPTTRLRSGRHLINVGILLIFLLILLSLLATPLASALIRL